jgi:hypothetical protein
MKNSGRKLRFSKKKKNHGNVRNEKLSTTNKNHIRKNHH